MTRRFDANCVKHLCKCLLIGAMTCASCDVSERSVKCGVLVCEHWTMEVCSSETLVSDIKRFMQEKCLPKSTTR